MNKIIEDRIKGIRQQLLGGHQGGIGVSSATKGRERETFIDDFLKAIYPNSLRFGTGDIIDTFGNKSGQIDIVVEFPLGPSLPSNPTSKSRLFFAELVAAVVEVKSDLNDQWKEVKSTVKQLNQVQKDIKGSYSTGYFDAVKIPVFAIGYTGMKKIETLANKMNETDSNERPVAALVIESGCYYNIYEPEKAKDGIEGIFSFICDFNDILNSVSHMNYELKKYL